MPVNPAPEDHPAYEILKRLATVVVEQNKLLGPAQDAALRVRGLGTEEDREAYQKLCESLQRYQLARERIRADASAAGASPKLIKIYEQYAEQLDRGSH